MQTNTKAKVFYYLTSNGGNPVREFIDSLSDKQKAKIFKIFRYIEFYGLISVLPHIKKVVGTPFWEIRVLGQDNIRILYITIQNGCPFLLHGFLKKTQKTSKKELGIAYERLSDWQKR